LDIEFDPGKAAANACKHGVTFADAEVALGDPCALTRDDPDSVGEPRFVTLGMDGAWRLLVVVYTLRGDRLRLSSARKATRREARAYHA
jgi:uncharacterized DUF497 family protein